MSVMRYGSLYSHPTPMINVTHDMREVTPEEVVQVTMEVAWEAEVVL